MLAASGAIWDRHTGELLQQFEGRHRELEFSPDGKLLAGVGRDGTLRVWDVASGQEKLTIPKQPTFGVAFHPQGKWMATSGTDEILRLWDLDDGSHRVFGKRLGRVYRISVSPDGRYLGAPYANKVARIWNIASGEHTVLRGHRSEVNVFEFSADSRLAVTSSDDGTVRLWDVETSRPVWHATTLLGNSAPESATWLLSHRGWLDLAAASGKPSAKAPSWLGEPLQAALLEASLADQSGDQICVRSGGNTIAQWKLGAERASAVARLDGPGAVLATPSGCLATGSKQALLLGVEGGKKELSFRGSPLSINHIGHRSLLATDREVVIFDSSGTAQQRFTVGAGVSAVGAVSAKAAAANSATNSSSIAIMLGYGDGSIELRSTDGALLPVTFRDVPSRPVVRLLPGRGRTVVAGFGNGIVGLWDLSDGTRLWHQRLYGAAVHLTVRGGVLFAATDLADHLSWDLGSLSADYCTLLRSVWRRAPVVWRLGQIERRQPPNTHYCRRP